MNSEAYRYILAASIAGGFTGALVMWNRKRSQVAGESKLRRFAVLTLGTAASAGALFAFTRAFRDHPQLYAVMVMILVTNWVAVLHSVMRLPVPRFMLRVRAGEFALLRAAWTGVRLFGALLRNTLLRHLGGRVYLSDASRDPLIVLRGLYDAEAIHIGALGFSLPWLVFWGIQGRWMLIIWGLAVYVPLNVYPILHLRYVTWRIEGYMARVRCRENAQPCAAPNGSPAASPPMVSGGPPSAN